MEFEVRGRGSLLLRVVDDPDATPLSLPSRDTACVVCQFVPAFRIEDRFDVEPGMLGTFARVRRRQKVMSDVEREEAARTEDERAVLDTFFAGEYVDKPVAKIDGVYSVPRTVHRAIYGREAGYPKASRNMGYVALKMQGNDPFEKWSAYLAVVGLDRAMRNKGFVRFARSD